MSTITKAPKLTPPDKKQCQAMKPNGNTFMTFGGVPSLVRCKNKPTVILTERKPNPKDGQRGSMSLCNDCRDVLLKQLGEDFATTKPIK